MRLMPESWPLPRSLPAGLSKAPRRACLAKWGKRSRPFRSPACTVISSIFSCWTSGMPACYLVLPAWGCRYTWLTPSWMITNPRLIWPGRWSRWCDRVFSSWRRRWFQVLAATPAEVVSRMPPVILIPVKDPEQAKLRMAPALASVERSRRAWAMLQDVARALRSISPASQIAVVTGSTRAANAARELGWRIFWESEQISESASVDRASNLLAMQGTEAVLRLPADI